MKSEKSRQHDESSRDYLEKVMHAYILNGTGTIYKPKAEASYGQADQGPPGSLKSRPFWVNVIRDWPVFLVSVATLILLIATVLYAKKQWQESNRSADATVNAVTGDWQAKLPVMVAGGLLPIWEVGPNNKPRIDMKQRFVNSGEAAARDVSIQWGWGIEQAEAMKGHWPNRAWRNATVTRTQEMWDDRKMTLKEATILAKAGAWFVCGSMSYRDDFPIRPDFGHPSQSHEGKWCIRITNFQFSSKKDGTKWDANVACVDKTCDEHQ